MLTILKKLIQKLVAILSDSPPKKLDREIKLPKEERVSAQICPELKVLPLREEENTLKVKDDSPRIKKELISLKSKNKNLHDLIIDLHKYINKEFNKNTVITMIYRTQKEQDSLYSYSEKYKEKPWRSPHQFWHSIDLRSRIYTEEEIDKVVKYLNDKYNDSNYYKWTAKAHAIKGNAMHFHIQYFKER